MGITCCVKLTVSRVVTTSPCPLLGAAALVLASTVGHVQAATVPLNICVSSCTNIGGSSGGFTATVAELEIVQNGTDVDFTLTNLVGNLGSYANSGTKLTQLLFTYTGTDKTTAAIASEVTTYWANNPASWVDADIVGGSNGISAGSFNNASLDFNLEIDLAPPGDEFFNNETLSWTIEDVSAVDFLASLDPQDQSAFAMVHLQSLGGCGQSDCGSVKIANGPTMNNLPMPEPGTLAIFGIGLIGLQLMRRRAV